MRLSTSVDGALAAEAGSEDDSCVESNVSYFSTRLGFASLRLSYARSQSDLDIGCSRAGFLLNNSAGSAFPSEAEAAGSLSFDLPHRFLNNDISEPTSRHNVVAGYLEVFYGRCRAKIALSKADAASCRSLAL